MTKINVNITSSHNTDSYIPSKIFIDSHCIYGCDTSSNLGNYLGYCSEELYEERIIPIQEAINNYNDIVEYLWNIEGFKEFFTKHNSYVTKKEIEISFGSDIANKVFSLSAPPFCLSDLIVINDVLFLRTADYKANFTLDNKSYTVKLNGDAKEYPNESNDKIFLWNWVENDTDFSFNFVSWIENTKTPILPFTFYDFDSYDQWRGSKTTSIFIVEKILYEINKHGYLEKYKLFNSDNNGVWQYYTATSDNSVGLYLIDKKFLKDKLLINKINALLDACSTKYDSLNKSVYGILVNPETEDIEINQKFFYLQDSNNATYISKEKGSYGGHYKLKIYGYLDCPSAKHYLSKGKYISNRVFFKDTKIAQMAGYRPCAKCMKKEYEQ